MIRCNFAHNSLPWNQETISGYFGEICFGIIASEAHLFSNGLVLVLFISICFQHQAMQQIFQKSLENQNDFNPLQNNDEKLRKLIRFHVASKE